MGLGRIALKELIIYMTEQILNPGDSIEDIKLDEEALAKYKYVSGTEKPDLYDKELQKTDPDMFKRMLSSVITEIRAKK
jgi:hypothetical protein